MPKHPKLPRDINERAHSIVALVTGEAEPVNPDEGKNPNAVALGRLGGLKGGVARAKALSSTRRKEIAKKAASTRWTKLNK